MTTTLHKPLSGGGALAEMYAGAELAAGFNGRFAALFEQATGDTFLRLSQAQGLLGDAPVGLVQQTFEGAKGSVDGVGNESLLLLGPAGARANILSTHHDNGGLFESYLWLETGGASAPGGVVEFVGFLRNDAALQTWLTDFVPQLEALFQTRAVFDGVTPADEVGFVHRRVFANFDFPFVQDAFTQSPFLDGERFDVASFADAAAALPRSALGTDPP